MTHDPRALLLAASLALAGPLSGCVPAYVGPQGGPTAKLVLRQDLPPGWTPKFQIFEEPHACTYPARLVQSDGSASTSTTLRAGPLATLSVFVSNQRKVCTVVSSFYPVEKHTYLLVAGVRDDRCYLGLLDATNGDEPVVEKSFFQRRFTGSCPAPTPAELSGRGLKADGSAPPPSLDDFKSLLEP